VRRAAPDAPVRILDLAAPGGAPAARRRLLTEQISDFRPDVIAFSWRDLQVFSPHDMDGAMRHAFTFFYDPSPAKKAAAAIAGVGDIIYYKGALSEGLALVAAACKAAPAARIAAGGPAVTIFGELLRPRLPQRVRLITDLPQLFPFLSLAPPDDPFEPMLDLPALEGAFPQWTAYTDSEIGVQTKRGCPQQCLYCLYGFLEGRQVRRRAPARVVKEIADYRTRWGARRFWLADAQLLSGAADEDHLADILGRLIAQRLDVTWSGYLRVNGLKPGLAQLMVESGLRDIEVALNSGAQGVLDELRMGFSADEVIEGLSTLASAGYSGRIKIDISLNSPGETQATLRETIGVVERMKALFGPDRVVPVIFFLAVQPHTGLEKRALADGRIGAGYDPLSVWPWDARRLIYNPPPLDRVVGRSCALAFRKDAPESGDLILQNLEAALSAATVSRGRA
jgi:hypothetical protein